MQTIEQLLAGELINATKIKISCGLTAFPNEILGLSETLEYLDLSGNQLSSLPGDFDKLKKLKILFLSDNNFKEIPNILSRCESLEMIGFKANQIESFPEDSIPITTRWLILTNNRLTSIPKSIGKCKRLQKCMLAGNLLKEFPPEMANCYNLELLRISANKFDELPEWLLKMPRLSWLAFAGNTFNKEKRMNNNPTEIAWQELEILEMLGEGASGVIFRSLWNKGSKGNQIQPVAVKI
ncbi:MAG TPA: leucine-rich repeat-containing protein kinase family protein, partial [Cytophagaceae bacterium]